MKSLKNMSVVAKILIILTSMVISLLSFGKAFEIPGYLGLLVAGVVLFEGFSFQLHTKILISLVMGAVLALSNLVAAEYLIAMRPVGSRIFMNLLTMSLVPLVFSSILTGVTSLGDVQKLNRIGLKTFIYYLVTTAAAISIGLVVANVFQPGKGLSKSVRASLESSYEAKATATVDKAKQNKRSFFETVQDIVPKNIFASISSAKPDMLALIFFAILCGIAILHMAPDGAETLNRFFAATTDMTIKLVVLVMRFAPYGIFAIIASNIAQTESADLLLALLPFSGCVLLGLLLHAFVVNGISLKYLSKKPVFATINKMRAVLLTAFSTASSGATMPLTLEVAEDELDVSPEVAGFVVPLGATINMDGTALFQGISTIFLANIYAIDLNFVDQLTIVALAVVASIGTAAVPGVGIVILTMILVSVNVPPEGILFILPVNNLLDMCRTAVNVMGDMTCSIYIDKSENT